MIVIALDPATHCGYVCGHVDLHNPDVYGVWVLQTKKKSNGARLRILEDKLATLIDDEAPDCLVFERPGTLRGPATRVLPAIVGIIEKVCHDKELPCFDVSPSTVKKHATGVGVADKIKMTTAAQRRWTDVEFDSSDLADAFWIWDLARTDERVNKLRRK